jgi:hypothetical protein
MTDRRTDQERRRHDDESAKWPDQTDQDSGATLNAPPGQRPDGRDEATEDREASGDQRYADDT